MVGNERIHTVLTSSHVYNSFTATNFWNYLWPNLTLTHSKV